jgi:hypothetical protein
MGFSTHVFNMIFKLNDGLFKSKIFLPWGNGPIIDATIEARLPTFQAKA